MNSPSREPVRLPGRLAAFGSLVDPIALAIVVVGIALRLTGSAFGLPFLYDPDEPRFADHAIKILETGDLNPHWFGHPGSLTIYSLGAVFGLLAAISRWLGFAPSLHEGLEEYWRNPAPFYFLGRLLGIAIAAAGLVLTYGIGKRIGGVWAGRLACLMVALAPLHVELSRLIRTDLTGSLWMLAGLWFAFSIAERGRARDYALAGIFVGLGVATKYPTVFLAVPILTAHALYWQQPREMARHLPLLALSGGAALAAAFLTAPFLFLDFAKVLVDLRSEARSYHLSATSPGFVAAVGGYVRLLAGNLSWVALVFAGIGVAAYRTSRPVMLTALLALSYFLFIASLSLWWARWMVPVAPLVSILAALGMVAACRFLSARLRQEVGPIVVGALVLVSLAAPLRQSWRDARGLLRVFAETEAREWVLANVPAGATIAFERYTAFLPIARYKLLTVRNGRLAEIGDRKRIDVTTSTAFAELDGFDQFERLGVDYVLLGRDYLRRKAEPERNADALRIYDRIRSEFERVAKFRPQKNKVAGGPVEIYRVPKPATK